MNEPYLYAGKPHLPPPSMQLRVRKEVSTKDAMNARLFEQWQTDAPYLEMDRADLSGAKILNDMQPINARAGFSGYTASFNAPLIKTTTDLSGAKELLDFRSINTRTERTENYYQSQPFVPTSDQLSQNPYFDRYDPAFDPRNAVRELRSVVHEDKAGERGITETRLMLERTFTSRWLPEGFVENTQMNSLLSYELLRPRFNDMSRTYRK
jgi:hypothetical protein